MGHGADTSFFLRLVSIALPGTGAVSTGSPTQQLTATPKDQAVSAISEGDYAPTYLWASSDPTKATVSQSGLVTKVAAGSTNITVSVTLPKHLGGQTITSNACAVTVT